jgi:hypothetical protein
MKHLDEHEFADLLRTVERGGQVPPALAADDQADLALAGRFFGFRADWPLPATPPWVVSTAGAAAGSGTARVAAVALPALPAGSLVLPRPSDVGSRRTTPSILTTWRTAIGSARRPCSATGPIGRGRWSPVEGLAIALIALLALVVVVQRVALDRSTVRPRVPASTGMPPSVVAPAFVPGTPTGPREPGVMVPSVASTVTPQPAAPGSPVVVPGATGLVTVTASGSAKATVGINGSGADRRARGGAAPSVAETPAATPGPPYPPPYPPPFTAPAPPTPSAPPSTATSRPDTATPVRTAPPAHTRPPSSTPFIPTPTASLPPMGTVMPPFTSTPIVQLPTSPGATP